MRFSFLEGRTIRVEDVHTSTEYDFSGPIRYDAITGYHTQSMLVVPMHNREGEKLGVIQLINALDEEGKIQAFPEDMILALESVTSQAAVTIQNSRYMKEIRELFQSFVRVMSAAVDERSPYNANHSRRMARFGGHFVDFLNQKAKSSGKEAPFPPQRKEELVMSVLLHDIGKVTTPLEVMNKPERLYELQKTEIRRRMEAIRLLGKIACMEGRISPAEPEDLERETRETEEAIWKMSTAGFLPDERLEWLEGVRRRTYADAEGQERPYKPGMPVEKALSILDAMANKEGKLDPELTALFVESRCWEGIPLVGDLPDGAQDRF